MFSSCLVILKVNKLFFVENVLERSFLLAFLNDFEKGRRLIKKMRKTEEFFDWNADEIAFQLFHEIVVNISIISNKAEEN